MTDKRVLPIVSNQDDERLWTAWVGTELARSVTSLAQAVERSDTDEQDLLVQSEAYDQMVAAGVAKPGATPGADWHDFV
jgi:hypothetical protein